MPKRSTQDINAVSCQSAFSEGLAEVLAWTSEHDKSTFHVYTNIALNTEVRGVAMMFDNVCKFDSDMHQ